MSTFYKDGKIAKWRPRVEYTENSNRVYENENLPKAE